MYVGRFLVAAPGVGAYRVSSRSFPNRRMIARETGADAPATLTVAPTPDAPETDNPYVSYDCLRVVADPPSVEGPAVALGNGSHVDPVAEKLALGYPARDALAEPLLALDHEKDDYDTPRIAAVVEPDDATVGVVRRDALLVEAVEEPHLVATYEKDAPEPFEFEAETAHEAADAAYDLDFEHAVCAAGAAWTGEEWETAVQNG
ncbi:IMP cyclohydrolase [Halobacteriales archaeon QS_1_68_20]|nr:MAG: IMP cyclohydrolase [Halobacteriales archaeon QS_1_68_20]